MNDRWFLVKISAISLVAVTSVGALYWRQFSKAKDSHFAPSRRNSKQTLAPNAPPAKSSPNKDSEIGPKAVELYNLVARFGEQCEEYTSFDAFECAGCKKKRHGHQYQCIHCRELILCEKCSKEHWPHITAKIKVRIPYMLRNIPTGVDQWIPPTSVTFRQSPIFDQLDTESFLEGIVNEAVRQTNFSQADIHQIFRNFECLADTYEPDTGKYGISRAALSAILPTRYVSDEAECPLFDFIFRFYDGDGDGLISCVDYIRAQHLLGSTTHNDKKLQFVDKYCQWMPVNGHRTMLPILLVLYLEVCNAAFDDAYNIQKRTLFGFPFERKLFEDAVVPDGSANSLSRVRMVSYESTTWDDFNKRPNRQKIASVIGIHRDKRIRELVEEMLVGPSFLEVVSNNEKLKGVVLSLFEVAIL